MAGLSSKHLTALLALGVVNGNAALATLHEYDKTNYKNRDNCNCQQHQNIQVTLTRRLKSLTNCTRQTSNNPGEDQNGNAVTDTTFGNLLSQPHHKYRTGDERRYCCDVEINASGESNALAGKTGRDAEALDRGKQHSPVTGVLSNLAATGFTFFLQLFKLGTHRRQQLHDNGRRDVRHDAQCENTHTLQCTTGEHVEHLQNGALVLFK